MWKPVFRKWVRDINELRIIVGSYPEGTHRVRLLRDEGIPPHRIEIEILGWKYD